MKKKEFVMIDPLGMRLNCTRKRLADSIRFVRKYGGTVSKKTRGYEVSPNGGNSVVFIESEEQA